MISCKSVSILVILIFIFVFGLIQLLLNGYYFLVVEINIIDTVISIPPRALYEFQSPFKIDIVYTYAGEGQGNNIRVRDNAELKYSLRSVYYNLKWINNIYIVMSDDSTIPSWIDWDCIGNNSEMNISLIKHSTIFHNKNNSYNTSNSLAIEMNLHRIPNLSQHFIYFNDDFFIGDVLNWTFFFNGNGIPRIPLHFWKKYLLDWNSIKKLYDKHRYFHDSYYCDIQHPNMSIPNVRAWEYTEHMPRSFLKDELMQFEKKYLKWVLFVESHKKRFGCQDTTTEESIYLHVMGRRITNEFKIEPFEYQHIVESAEFYHTWLHRKNYGTGEWQYKLNFILKFRPSTICINDDDNIDDHIRGKLKEFMQTTFPHPLGCEFNQVNNSQQLVQSMQSKV